VWGWADQLPIKKRRPIWTSFWFWRNFISRCSSSVITYHRFDFSFEKKKENRKCWGRVEECQMINFSWIRCRNFLWWQKSLETLFFRFSAPIQLNAWFWRYFRQLNRRFAMFALFTFGLLFEDLFWNFHFRITPQVVTP
jgi:hypothetical protein